MIVQCPQGWQICIMELNQLAEGMLLGATRRQVSFWKQAMIRPFDAIETYMLKAVQM